MVRKVEGPARAGPFAFREAHGLRDRGTDAGCGGHERRFVIPVDRIRICPQFGSWGDGRVIEDCIGSVYDAALSPEHWGGAVDRIAGVSGAKVPPLHGGLHSLAEGGGGWSSGVDPDPYRCPPEMMRPPSPPRSPAPSA